MEFTPAGLHHIIDPLHHIIDPLHHIIDPLHHMTRMCGIHSGLHPLQTPINCEASLKSLSPERKGAGGGGGIRIQSLGAQVLPLRLDQSSDTALPSAALQKLFVGKIHGGSDILG